MKWIIIAVVLLAAFGPVLWLVPSRADRRLAAMRARARSRGLQVSLDSIADPHPTPEARVSAGGKRRDPVIAGTTYELPLSRQASLAPSWALLRGTEAGPPGVAGWQWIGAPAGSPDYWQVACDILLRLPSDVLSCAADGGSVRCFWRERVGDKEPQAIVDLLAECLTELADLQQAHHVAREAERERERLLESDARDEAKRPQG